MDREGFKVYINKAKEDYFKNNGPFQARKLKGNGTVFGYHRINVIEKKLKKPLVVIKMF